MIYLEAPCFGFGPISTSLEYGKIIAERHDVVYITHGAAAILASKANATILKIDTTKENNFQQLSQIMNKEQDIVITNTNLEFAEWLIANNYKCIIVDTLFWMWNDIPKKLQNYPNYIALKYYVEVNRGFPVRFCRPILDYVQLDSIAHNKQAHKVLITFNGMAEPLDNKVIVDFAYKLCDAVLHRLIKVIPQMKMEDITIVGGLLSRENASKHGIHPKVRVLSSVEKNAYMYELAQSDYIFALPGLNSIYELSYLRKHFFLFPAFNVSQMFQLEDFRMTQYPYSYNWKNTKQLLNEFKNISEIEGIQNLLEYITFNIDKEIPFLEAEVERYILGIPQKIDINVFDESGCKEIILDMLKGLK